MEYVLPPEIISTRDRLDVRNIATDLGLSGAAESLGCADSWPSGHGISVSP